jgi:hypothetical protein
MKKSIENKGITAIGAPKNGVAGKASMPGRFCAEY